MYNRNIEQLLTHLEQKKEKYQVTITARIRGDLKNKFIGDCQKRCINESKLLPHIIETYYEAIRQHPHLLDKEMVEIKSFIIDRIKL